MVRRSLKPSWDRLYELAAPQSGYFTLGQARQAGYSAPLLSYHVRVGRLERAAARGVYRLAHFPPSDHEDLVVIWLWSKGKGVFSHETALMLHELSDALPASRHLSVSSAWARRRLRVPAGVVLHYQDVPEGDRAWLGSVPITTARRTIIDCSAEHIAPTLVAQATEQALGRGYFSRRELELGLTAQP